VRRSGRVKGSFLEQLSEPRPDPGGGAAAVYACALGVALIEKVIRLEIQRPAGRPEDYWSEALAKIQKLSFSLNELREKDCAAYLKLAERRASSAAGDEMESAINEAIACPVETIETSRLVLGYVSRAGNLCKSHLASDLQVACELIAAAIMGSYHIAAANLQLFRNEPTRVRVQLDLSAKLDSALKLLETVRQELMLRTRLPPRNR
jgi:formiminotetrahydrofolate cyclodeaminase